MFDINVSAMFVGSGAAIRAMRETIVGRVTAVAMRIAEARG